jgi:hypothetical protein
MRDDFDNRTKELLAQRVGYSCSNPRCRQQTSGPQEDPAKAVNIGVAAHITAASAGGPRYDPRLSTEERKSPENGIWLCQNCAKLVDNDEHRYNVGLLKKWKRSSEDAALSEIEEKRSGLPESNEPVGIKPKTISLGGPDGSRFGQFIVTNRTNDPCWQVWIKITVSPPVVDPEALEIDILEHSHRGSRTQRFGDLSIEPVHLVTDDPQGNRARFLMIQQMRPLEYLSYYVRVSTAHVTTDLLLVCLDLFDVGSEPLGMVFQGDQPAFKIRFPVPLKGKGKVWMRGSYPIKDS